MIRIAINGFGRIGRQALKVALIKKNIKVVAINDLEPSDFYAYLLRYDTVYGRYDRSVKSGENFLEIGNVKIPKLTISNIRDLPWKKLGVDVVLECTGVFTKTEDASKHVEAGAKAVVISAPSKGENPAPTFVIGVNDDELSKTKSRVISNASCTTNCIAPVIDIIRRKFGVVKSLMTTIHAYTATQTIVDGGRAKDFREARSAAMNIVPSSTGAAKATALTIPDLRGKFDGISMRVPVISGSISDITMLLKKKTTVEEINNHFRRIVKLSKYRTIIAVSEDPIVSTDILGTTYSAIVDLLMTRVIDGDFVKVVAWYDNEWAYSVRLVELAERFSKTLR